MVAHDELVGALLEAQRLGMIGPGPIDAAVEHAGWFVEALQPLAAGSTVVDLGSGGGLPGLVLAAQRPDLSLLLIDRRQKRADFLRRMIRRLGFDHVEVSDDDVGVLARRCAARFDAVTARGFGPPEVTLRLSVELTRPGGMIVISEPPDGDRWQPDMVEAFGLERCRIGAVQRFMLPLAP